MMLFRSTSWEDLVGFWEIGKLTPTNELERVVLILEKLAF